MRICDSPAKNYRAFARFTIRSPISIPTGAALFRLEFTIVAEGPGGFVFWSVHSFEKRGWLSSAHA